MTMSHLLARNVGESLAGVHNTFSSWDKCMSKVYCKWPVIAAIVVGALIALSLIWCVARCLCCGVECCCGCLACCNACCPSPRRRDKAYHHAPPISYQYQQPPPMTNPYFASGGARPNYGGGARSVAQTATFESPSQKHNEDALPAMPSWSNASSRRVEQPHEPDDVELERMGNGVATSPAPPQAQNERLLHRHPDHYGGQQAGSTADFGYRRQETAESGDIGYMGAGHAHMYAQPYHDHDQQRQQPESAYGSQHGATGYYTGAQAHDDSAHGVQNSYSNVSEPYSGLGYDGNPTAPAAYRSAMSGGYYPAGDSSPLPYPSSSNDFYSATQARAPSYAKPKAYESNISPPSYRSEVVSPIGPLGVLTPGGGVSREPLQGSWRDV